MMKKVSLVSILVCAVLSMSGCDSSSESSNESTSSSQESSSAESLSSLALEESYRVAWNFLEGDCKSNRVDSVEATFTSADSSFSGKAGCEDEFINLGALPSEIRYDFEVLGKDENGRLRSKSHGYTEFTGISPFPNEYTLRPVGANVKVTWNGCPTGAVLPYVLKLKQGSSTVDETQIQCTASEYEFSGVDDGTYTVELKSNITSHYVSGSEQVTVEYGEDAVVVMGVPVH